MMDEEAAAIPEVKYRTSRWKSVDGVATILLVACLSLFVIPGRFAIIGLKFLGLPSILSGFLAAFLWLTAFVSIGRGIPRGWAIARMILLVYLLGALVSFGVAISSPLDTAQRSGAGRSLLQSLAFVGLGLLACDGLRSPDSIKKVVQYLLICAYFSALVGLGQRVLHLDYVHFFSRVPFFRADGSLVGEIRFGVRAHGTGVHPIEFAVVSGAMIPLSIWEFGRSVSRNQRILHVFGAGLLGFGAFVSVSRSGAVAAVLAIYLSVVIMPVRAKLNTLSAAVVVLLAVQVFAHGVLSTIRYLFLHLNTDTSATSRTSDYSAVSPIVHEHYWFGLGSGVFQPAEFRYLDNQWLGTLVGAGVVGVVLFLALFLVPLYAAGVARRGTRDADLGQLVWSLCVSLVIFGVCAYLFDEFAFRQAAASVFIIIGLIGAAERFARTESATERTPRLATAMNATGTSRPVDVT